MTNDEFHSAKYKSAQPFWIGHFLFKIIWRNDHVKSRPIPNS